MPPVSLPLNGGTVSACAGRHASIPAAATRPAITIFRIADSMSNSGTLERIGKGEKNMTAPRMRTLPQVLPCCT